MSTRRTPLLSAATASPRGRVVDGGLRPGCRQRRAHRRSAHYRPGRPDLSKAAFDVLPVQGNVHLIVTGAGSNIVAQVGDQGALLVDASVPSKRPVIAEMRRLTRAPSAASSTPAWIWITSAVTPASPHRDSRCSRAIRATGRPVKRRSSRTKRGSAGSACRRPDAAAGEAVADRHILHPEEETVLQPRADRDSAGRRRSPTAT